MRIVRQASLWVAIVVAWSCGNPTGVDRPPANGVATVVVTPSSSSLAVGAELPLQVVVEDASGIVVTQAAVTWTVKDSTVATVSTAGVVTARGVGSTQVAANSSGKSGIAVVNVMPRPVARVNVLPGQIQLTAGDTARVKAVTQDAAQNILGDRVVIWASSNQSVATVDAGGLIKAVAPGSATVTATSEGQSGSATVAVSPVPVGSITLQPTTTTLVVGASLTLDMAMKDAHGLVLTDRVAIWSSSNTSVATVSTGGVVNALAVGTATITATSEGQSSTVSVTVTPVPVGSIVVQPISATLIAGASSTFTALVKDANGVVVADRVVSWSSSNPGVATVSPSGGVTAMVVGTATIRATSEGKTATATLTVVATPIASVTLVPDHVELFSGDSTRVNAVTRDAANNILTGRPVTWTSSDQSVASVDPTGLVHARAPGVATIKATSEGQNGTMTIAVSRVPVAAVVVAPDAVTMNPGQTRALGATTRDATGAVLAGRVVAWASSDAAIASVSQNGVVTAVSVGTATITATSEGKSGNTVVTITPVPVGSVAVSSIAGPLRVGQTATLAATVKNTDGVPVTDRVVTWASSNQAVATVSSAGLVTAVGPGSATITATSEGQSGSTEVVVLAPVASVALQPASVTLELGGTRTLTATMTSADGSVLTGRSVTYESDNNGIVSVSSTGAVAALVTGVGYGTATITATSEGKTATTKVVVQPTVAFVFMSPIIQVVTRGTTVQLSAIALDASNHQVFGRDVVWTSSDTAVATVSADGLLTTRKTGTVTITATIDGVSGSEKITVAKPKDDDSSSGDPGDE